MYLVISTSLNPASKSRVLADHAVGNLQKMGVESRLVDLRDFELPLCDGGSAFGAPHAVELKELIRSSAGVILASPIYNYDMGSAAKNLLELTGDAWTQKVVGFLLAAGGAGSYMSGMGFANSLMLDFRCLILPSFVYASPLQYDGNKISDADTVQRIHLLSEQLVRVSSALASE